MQGWAIYSECIFIKRCKEKSIAHVPFLKTVITYAQMWCVLQPPSCAGERVEGKARGDVWKVNEGRESGGEVLWWYVEGV